MNQPILKRAFADIPIFEYGEVDSTHEIARNLLETGQLAIDADKGVVGAQKLVGVVSATHQTKGRGRRDRVWESEPGSSMLATFIVKKRDNNVMLDVAHTMSIVAKCISVGEAAVSLKWPNDLVIEKQDFRKLGGCLTEILDSVLLIGVGINISPNAYSSNLKLDAICLEELGIQKTANGLLDEIIDMFTNQSGQSKTDESILAEYSALCSTIGRDVQIEQISRTLSGKAIGINQDGALVLKLTSGKEVCVSEGDVVHVRG